MGKHLIRRGAEALARGGRLVIADFKKPPRWPGWLVKLFVFLTGPFGVTIDLAERRPWESVERCLKPLAFEEAYFRGVYIPAGEK